MFSQLSERIDAFLDQAASYLWQEFEKDLILVEAISQRTEKLYVRITGLFR